MIFSRTELISGKEAMELMPHIAEEVIKDLTQFKVQNS